MTIFNQNYLEPPPHRKDRKYGEGGVLIAVNNNTISVQKENDSDCELVWTKVMHSKGDVIFGCLYRQPSSGIEKLEQLQQSLTALFNRGPNAPNIVLGGDFNLPDIDWETLSIKKKTKPQYGHLINEKMIEIVKDFNLTQIVNKPTRGKNTWT